MDEVSPAAISQLEIRGKIRSMLSQREQSGFSQ